jgi:hypothetical protein
MAYTWRWFLRMAGIVASGIVFAIVVLEIQLALGFRLVDSPLFRYPWPTVGLIAAALVFAAYHTWTTTTGAWASVGIAAFGIAVLPFNALLEPAPPPIAVDFWRGGGALRIERAMTVERTYPVVLVVSGPKDISGNDISGKTAAPTTGGSGPVEGGGESVVARLSGEPRSAFAVIPDKDEPKVPSAAGDMRWDWRVTPKQEGPQRLLLELDTAAKTQAGVAAKGNIYRHFVFITVQAPTWYEAARRWVIGLVSGS